mmetsp:Transcript_90170/g.135169  ORF Transcript_90170/g.135169 Transcript_90170/m.135169 type:complete len:224 (-) Transcript_90170:111-782(-)
MNHRFYLALGLPSILLMGCLPAATNASYGVTIEPKETECFDFRTPADRTSVVTGSFEVFDDDMDEGKLDVTITKESNGETIYRAPRDDLEGSFELKNLEESTRIQICFRNLYKPENGYDNSFDLGFAVRVSKPPRALEDGLIGPDTERAMKLVDKAAEIHKDWELMKDHQVFTRNREAIHEEMSAKILANLNRWTFTEAFLVIGMAVAQIMYWKRFFETKRYL